MKRALSIAVVSAGLLCASSAFALSPGDWAEVGKDAGGTKFSPLTQITPANVAQLKQAWSYDMGVKATGFRGLEVTPIVVDGIMYFPTRDKKVVALDPETGKTVWTADLPALGVKANAAKYGVSYWPGDRKATPRIVVATDDGFLLQLDARTGALFTKVGDKGLIDLKKGVMEKFGGVYTPGSTPAIYRNLAIISPRTGEQGRYGAPGDPRAFDLTTGKEVWRFHTVPRPGEANFGDWGVNGWQDRKGPGSWAPMTVDTANGLVFIALGNANDQNFGGNRPGNNSYAASVIALDANTGKLKWFFQSTHHDIFDWDVNAPPTLVDVVKDGRKIPAVAQSTKVGYLFILDRLTGKPVFGVEEKPVFASDVPGEKTSPTQPIPLKPAPIARVSMTREEVSRISPETVKTCQAQYDKAVQAGPDTPYMTVPSLVFPSSEGGGGWGGASYDPAHGMIFVNTRSVGTMGVEEPAKFNGLESWAKRKIPFEDKDGYPCSAPPWGELMAIDANTADIVWRVPLGEYKELTARGVPKTGTPNAGGVAVTASGLIFVGATADQMFRAFDAKTGKELWSTQLHDNAINTPMTYMGKNGKQYVAIIESAGINSFDRPKISQPGTDKLVVFALP